MAAVLTYAIGDIHGSYTKLANLLRHCIDHCGDNTARFVFLGDYVDRGKRSREVVALLIETQARWPGQVVCLMGNHEDMLLDAANRQDEMMWLDNGGDATLDSYGVTQRRGAPGRASRLVREPAARHQRRASASSSMPASCRAFLWRSNGRKCCSGSASRSCRTTSDHGLYIVHGHTPTDTGMPDLRPNRLNLDTLAWYGNPLIAAVFDERRVGPIAFIADDGTIRPRRRSMRASRRCTDRGSGHGRGDRGGLARELKGRKTQPSLACGVGGPPL